MNVQLAHLGHRLDKSFKVDLDIAVYVHAEILLDRLIEQFHATQRIRGVDAMRLISGDPDIHVAHEGNERDLACLLIDAADDHRV